MDILGKFNADRTVSKFDLPAYADHDIDIRKKRGVSVGGGHSHPLADREWTDIVHVLFDGQGRGFVYTTFLDTREECYRSHLPTHAGNPYQLTTSGSWGVCGAGLLAQRNPPRSHGYYRQCPGNKPIQHGYVLCSPVASHKPRRSALSL